MNDEPRQIPNDSRHAAAGAAARPRRIGPGAWVAIGFGVLLLLIVAGGAWVLGTQSGARWTADRAVGLLGGKLEVRDVRGTIAGPLVVGGIRWYDASSGVDVHVTRVALDIALHEVLAKRVHVQTLAITGVDVSLFEHPPRPEEPSTFSLRPPLDFVLDRSTLEDVRVSKDGKPLVVVRTAEAIAHWTSERLAIAKLVVDSPDGNVHFNGQVSEHAAANRPGTAGAHGSYVGRATGGFRWKLGEIEYAGELTATSEREQLDIGLRMSAPFPAQLAATLGETQALPWTFDLTVPKFDPRERLQPGSSLTSLAATLHGQGDASVAEIRGATTLNGRALRIDPLRVRYADSVLALETLKLIDPTGRGTLTAHGDVRFGGAVPASAQATPPPFYANLLVQWQGVSLPEQWVGQALASHGELKVVGSTVAFTADGALALGPPGRLADITVAIAGTPEEIKVKQLAVAEGAGRLSAVGSVQLKPRIGWQFNATARRFDPGKIVAGWPGRLDFALDTHGRLTESGPDISLDLKNLQGTLRGRALSGRGDLALSPRKVLAGTLSLRSGKSSLSVTGRSGKEMDADVRFDIASLDDWVSQAAGRLGGRFHVSGTWPELAVNGNAHARALALGEYSAKAIDISADVKNPGTPQGSLHVTGTELVAAGLTFSSAEINASGDEQGHSLALTATGQPLTAKLSVRGVRDGQKWAGSVDRLMLAVTGLEPLSLRAPARVSWSPTQFDVSESCLASEHMSACAAASRNEAGELQAQYRLEHLPLGLIAALAMPQLPMQIEAVIDGNGNIRRTPEGALFGDARISSASGRITDASTPAQAEAADALLTYENLQLRAQLAGEAANGTIAATLGKDGTLEGTVALANLRSSSASIDGHVKLVLPDLSPAALFVPQLAAVHGRGEANAQVAGSLSDPRITGEVALRELAAEVPRVGLKLHDGEVMAAVASDRTVTLSGQISSGDGQLTLAGDADTQGGLNVRVQGRNFVAADIPGARVIVEPDLDFERKAQKMTLNGTVTVPQADIDLSKLPRQGASVQRASPDVVVVDEKEDAAAEKSQGVPLEARVTVVLGKEVNLNGYGLTSRVEGQLAVSELPQQPTTATGELRVSGKYKAYGQDLTIEEGRVLYAGQQITDPNVNIVATRKVEGVTAKLLVTGSARKPLLQVTSDPVLPQTQALSYLVTGKPLSEVGSGEGDMVQAAARSLGGAAGNLLAKGLGRRLGIDQIGIENTPEAGGSAFTVGQYLSPRLYLGYGVGLFEPGQVVTLRYRLSSKASLEAVQGTLSQKAGINYRIEK